MTVKREEKEKTRMQSSSSAVLVGKVKWEDLNKDLLHSIFQRVEIDALLFDLPLVCKSWYQVSTHPQILQTLDFTNFSSSLTTQVVLISDLIQLAVKHSKQRATTVILPSSYILDNDTLLCIMQGCPALRSLTSLQDTDSNNCYYWEELFAYIHAYCKNIVELSLRGNFGYDAAVDITTYVPDIKYLILTNSALPRGSLILILSKCRNLELLDVRWCIGFDAEDDEILEMAFHIKTFMSEGSFVSYPPQQMTYSDNFEYDDWSDSRLDWLDYYEEPEYGYNFICHSYYPRHIDDY